ncbi:hypothetical protein [Gimesia algae]|uniref:Uncharacterized protein n=1 Tax=Gimesia algae TaxID=2527971 RepID=A0A517VFE9_9PLAN|nr:hypothetical protein [Gimesia algae]QDT91745.1 hypothetical protein Pan161_34080 [Gimesia algae]
MNEFYKDAAYFSARCTPRLSPEMQEDDTVDCVLYFAFCVERLFKGVLWDIDPRLIFENSKDENCFAMLHREKLIPSIESIIDKSLKGEKPNHNTITFKDAMLKAKNFSQVTHDRMGVLSKLSDYRGILAHRRLSSLDYAAARRFTVKYFYPIISAFVVEHKLKAEEFFLNREGDFREFAEEIKKEDQFSEKMEELIEERRENWESRKDNAEFVGKARRLTEATLKDEQQNNYFHQLTSCPACENDAAVRFEVDWESEGSGGEGYCTGVYAGSMICEYCGLELDEYEQIDHFKLNEMLND